VEKPTAEEQERFRVEAIGAFSHEIRTPITSLKMLVELARRHGENGEGRLDAELMGLLQLTVDELTRLVDEVQESSRLMRGALTLTRTHCRLGPIVDAAQDALPDGVSFDDEAFEDLDGWWNEDWLAQVISGFASTADRLGAGDGHVRTTFSSDADGFVVSFESGTRAGDERPMTAEAGFAFFRARQFLLAMDGQIECERRDGFTLIRFGVPYGREIP
jgi:signal transduction histidine kinase